jgi:hypothetical protein
MRLRRPRLFVQHLVLGVAAILCGGARFVATRAEGGGAPASVVLPPAVLAGDRPIAAYVSAAVGRAAATPAVTSARDAAVAGALGALTDDVGPLSHPQALENAVRSYFAYRAAHPRERLKPLLYFVDYGLPSTTPRGYVFDMASLRVLEGPFTVAHGRGSSAADGVPSRFSNTTGSASTSLGLYVAQELYAFRGKTAGQSYHSVGLRLTGVSGGFNSNARARGVVAHGAPYVTARRAGRSEGCPAVEPARAARLLPKLAHGGLVFLFAPNARWMATDPWVTSRRG